MRIGKCPKCKKELYVSQMNWTGWREIKCLKCGFTHEGIYKSKKQQKLEEEFIDTFGGEQLPDGTILLEGDKK